MFVVPYYFAPLLIAVAVVGQSQLSDDATRRGKGWNLMAEGEKRSCVGLSGRPGVCMGQNECAKMNGKSVGKCFPFEACCSVTPNSCGGYSGASTSYFQSPDKFQNVCAYKVNVRRNVCQIRIDFERFSLGQPTKTYNESAYTCDRDEFTVLSNDNTKFDLPVLCGENSGQHVYVPIRQTSSVGAHNRQQITLKFRMTTRDEDYADPEPHWKIQISQLECQTTSTNWWKIKDIARQFWDWEEMERDSDGGSKTYSLAPDGCLQYFTDKTGTFESFNYNKGMGHYLGNLNYAVCFKRDQDACGIKYKAVKFQAAFNRNAAGFTDRDCDTVVDENEPTTTGTSTTQSTTSTTTEEPDITTIVAPKKNSKVKSGPRDARKTKWHADVSKAYGDYLLIPDGLYSQKFFASKYCGRSLEDVGDIKAKTKGPIYVAFVSDEYSNPDEDVEKGYKIDYSSINNGC